VFAREKKQILYYISFPLAVENSEKHKTILQCCMNVQVRVISDEREDMNQKKKKKKDKKMTANRL
jgi:hypothetical protein